MKKFALLGLSLILAGWLTFPFGKSAAQIQPGTIGTETTNAEETHGQTLPDVLNNILNKQGVTKVQDLDCDQISETELEKLGDAWMETIHPGQAHKMMDQMLGGEGSESLRLAHIQMGQNYLGCDRSGGSWMGKPGWGNRGGMMGMMGGGMMGGSGMWAGSANTGSFLDWSGVWDIQYFLWILIEILLVIVLILVVWKLFLKK